MSEHWWAEPGNVFFIPERRTGTPGRTAFASEPVLTRGEPWYECSAAGYSTLQSLKPGWFDDGGTNRAAPRVLIVLDSSAAWSRGVLRGFSHVAHEQGWSLFHYREAGDLEQLATELEP